MAPGWTPVRVIRWPAQAQDRAWCADRGIPRVVLVSSGVSAPDRGADEVVLQEPVDEAAVQQAVDSLAWGTGQPPDVEDAPSSRTTPPRRPRSVLGVVAALF